jgi:hypothetical protein
MSVRALFVLLLFLYVVRAVLQTIAKAPRQGMGNLDGEPEQTEITECIGRRRGRRPVWARPLADPNGFPIGIHLYSVGDGLQKDFGGARRKVAGYYVEQEPPFEKPALESARISYDYLHALKT